MEVINFYGAIFILTVLVPNVIFAAKHKAAFENLYHNKIIEIAEQIGRFGSFIFMIISLPIVCRGYWFNGAKTAYIIIGALLVVLYLAGWAIFWNESSVRKSLVLSVLPSLLFLSSGLFTLNIPLLIAAAVFAPCHIIISYKNAVLQNQNDN